MSNDVLAGAGVMADPGTPIAEGASTTLVSRASSNAWAGIVAPVGGSVTTLRGRDEAPGRLQPVRAVAAAVPAWCSGGEFTVGAEDELLLVGEDDRLLGGDAARVHSALCPPSAMGGAVTGEIFVDQIELNSAVCLDAQGVAASLGCLRRWVAEQGARPMAVGVHPDAGFGKACTVSSPRYDALVEEFAGLFRTPTAAFQVHVGLPDTQCAMSAYRGLRNRLAVLRALSASSPFWHRRDSGLASARSAILRSYPRVTVPPVLGSWEEYLSVTERIMMASGLPDYTYIWWDLRPQPRLGTLEIRVMDAQPSLSRVAGLTALVQGMARRFVEVPDAHDMPDDVLAANDHRAWRHGLDTTIMDVDGHIRPLREVATRTLAEARTALAPDGLERPLDAVEAIVQGQSEPQRQRRLHGQRGMRALLADLVERTTNLDG